MTNTSSNAKPGDDAGKAGGGLSELRKRHGGLKLTRGGEIRWVGLGLLVFRCRDRDWTWYGRESGIDIDCAII